MAKGNLNYTPKKWLDTILGLKNFGKVKVANITITPTNNNDIFELASGTNITLNANESTKKVIINGPSAVKNPTALTIQLNGTSQGAYDGSSAKTVNITAGEIGAAASNHSHTPASIGAASASHTHSASQVSGLPTRLPANGGNADTTDGYHFMVATSKPSSLSNNVICFVYE